MNEEVIKKGYKVVQLSRMNTSFFRSARAKAGAVLYDTNEWTHHKDFCGPLAVFESVADVLNFFKEYESSADRVFNCEYVEDITNNTLWQFEDVFDPSRGPIPKGTKFATKVKITEEISKDDLSLLFHLNK